MNNILQILSILLLPYFFIWLDSKSKIVRFFGPVILCYAGGALLGNLRIFDNPTIAEHIHISVFHWRFHFYSSRLILSTG